MTHRSRTSKQLIVAAAVLSSGAAHPGATHVGAHNITPPPPLTEVSSPRAAASGTQRAHLAYGKMPLTFVPNAGQADARVRFQAQAGGASFWFTPKEAVFSFAGKRKGHVLRLGFLGANSKVEIVGAQKGAATVNYLRGKDPSRWHAGLSTYEHVVYRDLWPGIDLAFRGEAGTLKYEFRVAPGADPDVVRLAYNGAKRLSLSPAGDLRIDTPLGVLTDSAPVSYQLVGGKRVPIESRYALSGRGYGFALGAYDRRRPLVIDPGLAYSTYLGGSGNDQGIEIAVDALGNAYVIGATSSADFPTTVGAFDELSNGGGDAFVTKLGPGGGAPLLYSTFLGGSGSDFGLGIAVDGAGHAYVTGFTSSPDFPTTAGAFDESLDGTTDAFVTKLGATGAPLLYSTYLGGSGVERGLAIAIDGTGDAYVTGDTRSTDFPTTASAFDPTFNGGFDDAYVTKLGTSGGAPLLYSTYLGGSSDDEGRAIAVDGAGNAYVTGATLSSFPTTVGAFDRTAGGDGDAFVTKLGPNGSAPLLYSTYLGGFSFEQGDGIAVDDAGNAYVTGLTHSFDFPTTAGAFDESHNGGGDAFVSKIGPSGGAPLLYSTYLGGGGSDAGAGIAVDVARNAYVTGDTSSADFPTTGGAFDESPNGSRDAFVTKLGASGSAPLLYSTYLGGSAEERGSGIAVDATSTAYVTGSTFSADFPTTSGVFDDNANGDSDAFVTRLDLLPAFIPATLALSPPTDTNAVGTSHTVTAIVSDVNANPIEEVSVRFAVAGSVSASGSCTSDANGQCDFTYQGPAFPGADVISAYADTNGNTVQDAGEPTASATKVWVLPASTRGQVYGAGQGRGAAGERITFGFVARGTLNGPQGVCLFERHIDGPNERVACLNATALVIVGNTATFYGNALHNGHSTMYVITARENNHPVPDEVTITTASGFSAGGPLEHGTVVVRD